MNFNKKILTKKSFAKNFSIILLFMSIMFTTVTPLINTFADDDGGEQKVTGEYNDYKGKLKYQHEVLGKFNNDVPDGRENSIKYLLSRVIVPQYINDVRSGVPSKSGDKSVLHGSKGSYYLCSKDSPQNLISYNCNIPNFSAQVGQSIMRVLAPGGISNGERSSAKPLFEWGVPDGIPTGKVPVNEDQRSQKYTGLEVFGYNTKFTSYNGEWDDIIPSTRARMLANFGLMDSINLTGTSIWNGLKGGFGAYIENLTWNPLSWLGSISKAWEAGTASSFLTIVDSSDMNIATTRAWVRSGSSVGSSFYNVKVLSDKEVLDAANVRVAKKFTERVNQAAGQNAGIKEVLDLQTPPTFTFDPNLESEKSKKARKKAADENIAIDKYNQKVDSDNRSIKAHNDKVDREGKGTKKNYRNKKQHVPVPPKEFVPESEQFADWKKKDAGVAKGNSKGIDCTSEDNYSDYKTCWANKWETYSKQEFDASSGIIAPMIELIKQNLMQDDPYADPAKAISHYVCADANGNPLTNSSGGYEYLYTSENNGSTENLNSKCLPVRPTLQGGLFGNGYSDKSNNDTRHISNVKNGDSGNWIQSLGMTVSKFFAQLTNEMLNLAFSPLMNRLGITEIIKNTLGSFRDTIFYPLVIIVVMVAAFLMFLEVIKRRSLISFFTSLLSMLLVFFIGAVLLNSPEKVVNLVDTIPIKGEQMLSSAILNSSINDGLCETDSIGSNNGIRSAQCHIWSTLVYQPWVFGQFGVSTGSLDTNDFTNKNGDLVGNAQVKLGGGVTMNNWAVYQLNEMTSGTITTSDSSNPVGKQSTNLYRLVDLQAGPNNGALSDSRYFTNWTGSSSNRTLVSLLSAILGVTTFIVVGGILLAKIELTFVSSLLLVGLPFMLLRGMTPNGKFQLLKYGATLFSLFLKRMIATVMISLMLVVMGVSIPDNADSYTFVFIVSMIVLLFFKMYKKEIFKIFNLDPAHIMKGKGFLSGDPDEIHQAFKKSIPQTVKNSYNITKSGVVGATAGLLGGALGGGAGAFSSSMEKRRERIAKGGPRFSTNDPRQILTEVLDKTKQGGKDGFNQGKEVMQSRYKNAMLRSNPDSYHRKKDIKNKVRDISADELVNGNNGDARVFRDINEDHRQFVPKYTKDKMKELRKSDSSQRRIRKHSRTVTAIVADMDSSGSAVLNHNLEAQMAKTASKLDSRMEKQLRVDKVLHPFNENKRTQLIENNRPKVAISVDEYSRTITEITPSTMTDSDTVKVINKESVLSKPNVKMIKIGNNNIESKVKSSEATVNTGVLTRAKLNKNNLKLSRPVIDNEEHTLTLNKPIDLKMNEVVNNEIPVAKIKFTTQVLDYELAIQEEKVKELKQKIQIKPDLTESAKITEEKEISESIKTQKNDLDKLVKQNVTPIKKEITEDRKTNELDKINDVRENKLTLDSLEDKMEKLNQTSKLNELEQDIEKILPKDEKIDTISGIDKKDVISFDKEIDISTQNDLSSITKEEPKMNLLSQAERINSLNKNKEFIEDTNSAESTIQEEKIIDKSIEDKLVIKTPVTKELKPDSLRENENSPLAKPVKLDSQEDKLNSLISEKTIMSDNETKETTEREITPQSKDLPVNKELLNEVDKKIHVNDKAVKLPELISQEEKINKLNSTEEILSSQGKKLTSIEKPELKLPKESIAENINKINPKEVKLPELTSQTEKIKELDNSKKVIITQEEKITPKVQAETELPNESLNKDVNKVNIKEVDKRAPELISQKEKIQNLTRDELKSETKVNDVKKFIPLEKEKPKKIVDSEKDKPANNSIVTKEEKLDKLKFTLPEEKINQTDDKKELTMKTQQDSLKTIDKSLIKDEKIHKTKSKVEKPYLNLNSRDNSLKNEIKQKEISKGKEEKLSTLRTQSEKLEEITSKEMVNKKVELPKENKEKLVPQSKKIDNVRKEIEKDTTKKKDISENIKSQKETLKELTPKFNNSEEIAKPKDDLKLKSQKEVLKKISSPKIKEEKKVESSSKLTTQKESLQKVEKPLLNPKKEIQPEKKSKLTSQNDKLNKVSSPKASKEEKKELPKLKTQSERLNETKEKELSKRRESLSFKKEEKPIFNKEKKKKLDTRKTDTTSESSTGKNNLGELNSQMDKLTKTNDVIESQIKNEFVDKSFIQNEIEKELKAKPKVEKKEKLKKPSFSFKKNKNLTMEEINKKLNDNVTQNPLNKIMDKNTNDFKNDLLNKIDKGDENND